MRTLSIYIFLLLSSGCINSQDIYIGYQENCMKIQERKIISVLKNSLESSAFNNFNEKGMLNVYYEVDSTGKIIELKILDSNYLDERSIVSFKKQMKAVSFQVCHSEFEAKHLTKSEFFDDGKAFYKIKIQMSKNGLLKQ